ncbi:hypothetical protein GCM10023175_28130 [Pseudonocardia xishanensis]|uniref:Uncharacterized protein n=1 Tax=Pseudonocardia xishanensis TaxID=630995 RepID=A0ABP8RRM3_9PSEU
MFQGEVHTLELTEASFSAGLLAAPLQVPFEIVEAEQHGRVDLQARAAEAGVLAGAGCGVGATAAAKLVGHRG